DPDIIAPALHAEGADALDHGAGLDAAAAEDTFRGIANDCRTGGIQITLAFAVFEADLTDAELVSDCAQLAGAVADAFSTAHGMAREQQLHSDLARLAHHLGIGGHFHPLCDLPGAGRAQET